MKKLVADAQSVVGRACAAYFYRVDTMKGIEFEYEYISEDGEDYGEDNYDATETDYDLEVDMEEPTISALKKMKKELGRKGVRKMKKVKRCIKLPPATCNCTNGPLTLMTMDYILIAFFLILSVNAIWIFISLFNLSYNSIKKFKKKRQQKVDINNNDREMDIRLTNFLNAHTPPTPPPTSPTPVMHDYEDVVGVRQEEEGQAENDNGNSTDATGYGFQSRPLKVPVPTLRRSPILRGSFKTFEACPRK